MNCIHYSNLWLYSVERNVKIPINKYIHYTNILVKMEQSNFAPPEDQSNLLPD